MSNLWYNIHQVDCQLFDQKIVLSIDFSFSSTDFYIDRKITLQTYDKQVAVTLNVKKVKEGKTFKQGGMMFLKKLLWRVLRKGLELFSYYREDRHY